MMEDGCVADVTLDCSVARRRPESALPLLREVTCKKCSRLLLLLVNWRIHFVPAADYRHSPG